MSSLISPGRIGAGGQVMGAPQGVFSLGQYPAVGPVHQNVPLTNLIVGYAVPGFIADEVFPVLPVNNESDIYYEFDKSPWFRREESLIPDRAMAREISWTFQTKPYTAQRYGYQATISQRERNNADSQLRLEANKLRFIKQLLQIDFEVRIAALLTKTNTSGVTLSGNNQWNSANFQTMGANTIEGYIDVAKEAVRQATGGLAANTIVVPEAVAIVLKKNATIRDLIKYTTNALVNGDMPDTLWGMKVYRPGSIYTTSTEGTAEASVTYSDVWGKDVRVMYVAPPGTADSMTPSVGYQFRLSDDNYTVSEWRTGAGRNEITYYEESVTQDQKLTLPTACYVIEAAIA